GDEDSAFFSAMQRVLTLLKPTVDEHGFDGTASPHIGAGIERIAQDVADQALRGNLPNQLRSLNRIRGQLDVVITKPLERLTHAPRSRNFANTSCTASHTRRSGCRATFPIAST